MVRHILKILQQMLMSFELGCSELKGYALNWKSLKIWTFLKLNCCKICCSVFIRHSHLSIFVLHLKKAKYSGPLSTKNDQVYASLQWKVNLDNNFFRVSKIACLACLRAGVIGVVACSSYWRDSMLAVFVCWRVHVLSAFTC